jgi:hypothetical protein
LDTEAARGAVRAEVATADRRRRRREVSRRVWRLAPVLAGFAVVVALVTRWIGLTIMVPLGVLAGAGSMLVAYAFFAARKQPVSDRVAALIDADAGLDGELRSASWFAERDVASEWADFHLQTAADRLQGTDWTGLYPRRGASRARAATAVLVATTLVVIFTTTGRVATRQAPVGEPVTAPSAAAAVPAGRMLDPELQKRLEELLAAAAAGRLPTAEAMAGDAEARDLLARLAKMTDAELLAALERAIAAVPDAETQATVDNLKKFAEQAQRAADAGTLSRELLEALEKLSDEVEMAQARDSSEAAEAAAASAQDAQKGDTGLASGAGGMEDLSIQFARDAQPGGGAGVMMMAPDTGQGGGPPGAGVGGSGSEETAASSAAAIEVALTQEVVEASRDAPGGNVESEIHRKTEHASATVTFTNSASGTFDRSRAAAPPPVPEARRADVQTYFIRK